MSSIVFVYLGGSLPRYAPASLQFARMHGGLSVVLLGQRNMEKQARSLGCEFLAVEDFYDSSAFHEAATRITLSHSFRAGFWLRTLERFFVLQQYMELTGCPDLLHVEMDQLVFRLDLMLHKLREVEPRGLFAPMHGSSAVVASVVFCNSLSALSGLTRFAASAAAYPNEMQLLLNWAAEESSQFHRLPTAVDAYPRSEASTLGEVNAHLKIGVSQQQLGGVVDAAQLGQWVGGIDPRNVPLSRRPMTKYADRPQFGLLSRAELSRLRLAVDKSSGVLSLKFPGGPPVSLYNLHLHSKIHAYLIKQNDPIARTLELANSSTPHRVPEGRRTQIVGAVSDMKEIVLKDPYAALRFGARVLRMHRAGPLRRRT